MAEVLKTVLVYYTPAEMFALVDAVEGYPQFLPWCGTTTLHQRDELTTEATIHIDYHHIRQQFTTVNTKRFPHEMLLRLKKGPFRRLDGFWRFHPLGEVGCKVEFQLNYEFSSPTLDKLLGPVFGYIAGTLVEAFTERAKQVYGER